LLRSFFDKKPLGNPDRPLKNNQVNAPVIIDIGSTENSFKAVTTMRGSRTSNVHALIIQEFIKDNKKPFVYLHDATVFYGVCTHY
jgi:hypothetical protein